MQSYAGPAQLKQSDGSWAWIDTTLVEQDGVLKPKLAKADVELSLGGNKPFASMNGDKGEQFALSWLKDLPRPEVAGNVATYRDAAGKGADLVVTALPTGFRHDVVLRERPTGPVEFRIPVQTDGLTFAENKKGGLQLTDTKGRQVASAAEPVATDAGPSPAEANTRQAVTTRSGKIDTRVVKDKGRQVLVLKPDPAFLNDPATRYPVTVDPTTTLTLQSDLVVDNTGAEDTSAASQKLVTKAARIHSDGHLSYSHSLLKFDTGPLAGRSVGSARLDMYADQLVGCRWMGPGGVEVKRVTSAWPVSGVGWSSQPSVTSFGSSIQLCPSTSSIDDNGNWIPHRFIWDITAMAQSWASGYPNHGIRLSAKGTSDPTQNTSWSVYFHSAERTGGTPPKLTVSYFLPPEIPTVTAESIDSMNGNDAIARSQSVKVGFKSSVPESTNLDYTVTVNDSTMAPPPVFPIGHVAHWKFDEAAGAAAAADSGPNGHTATYTGSRRTAVTGKLSSAVQLNDMTGSNGCCVPDSYASTSKAVLNQNSSFSLSTWVRLTDSEAVQHVASQDGDPFGMSIYYLGGSHQKWRLQISGTGGTTGYGVWVDSAKLSKVDTWTHLVAMYDASTAKIRLYVDGVLSGEADYQPSGSVTGGPFRIGGHKSGLNFLQGAVDDMRLYQRVLTLKEIKDLYGEVAATSYNAKPSGQVIEQTFQLDNPASLKFVVKACRSGIAQPSCNESPAYRITSDAPFLPTDTETGMADPTQPILSGVVSRPSGGAVTAKYFLYDNGGFPVGSSPLGQRTVNGGERASFQVPENTVQAGRIYTWQMLACVGPQNTTPAPNPTPTPTPTPTPDTSQKAHWTFDEGSGTVTADSSGNGRTATLNAASWGAGKSQNGLVLSGTSSYGVTNGPAVHTNDGYTVSAWARLDVTTREDAVVSQDGAVNSAFKLAYSSGDKKWRMVTYQSDTTNATPVRALSTQNAVADQWTHLVGVYDATAQKIRLYVDGVLNTEVAYTSTWDATSNVQIGRTKVNGAHNSYLKGTVDDIRLYQKSLTAAEITALYSGASRAAMPQAPTVSTQVTAESGGEVCTAKTAPVNFTVPGTPADPPGEEVRHLSLSKDNFVLKTTKTGPIACDGGPCPLTDSTSMQFGGTGGDKTVTVLGLKLDELPEGAFVSDAILKLGGSTCPAGACPADTVITAVPLKSAVTMETKGSNLAGDVDNSATYSLPIATPQANIAGSEYQWLLLSSNKDEVVTFGDAATAEQPSLALTYLPAGPPSKVLNLAAAPGDSGAVASWGLPESNGSVAMLNGYDVEVSDGSSVMDTLEVTDPMVVISSLTNGTSYTIKVRAKTRFGVGDWETTTVTPKAVPPPPPPSQPCIPADAASAQSMSVQTASSTQDYAAQIKNYYQAQDAVLEGRALTVWQAPGVTSEASITAKISLLNAPLTAEKQALDTAGVTRTNSTVAVENIVPQEGPNGAIRVNATIKRSWDETSTVPKKDLSATRKGATGTPGQVEPSEPTIDIIVFEFGQCGKMTVIQIPLDIEEDSTDFIDTDGDAFLNSQLYSVEGEAASNRTATTQAGSVCFKAADWPRTSNKEEWRSKKGLLFEVIGKSAWRRCVPREDDTTWNINKFGALATLYTTSSFRNPKGKEAKKQRDYILENSSVDIKSSACFKVTATTYQLSFMGALLVGAPFAGVELGGQFTLGQTAAKDCSAEMMVAGDKGGSNAKIAFRTAYWSPKDAVIATCWQSAGNTCSISQYQQRTTGMFNFSERKGIKSVKAIPATSLHNMYS